MGRLSSLGHEWPLHIRKVSLDSGSCCLHKSSRYTTPDPLTTCQHAALFSFFEIMCFTLNLSHENPILCELGNDAKCSLHLLIRKMGIKPVCGILSNMSL